MSNRYEEENREKKAQAIAGALVAEADQRGKDLAEDILPVVQSFADGEEKEGASAAGRYFKTVYDINPPSVITWGRVAEILTEQTQAVSASA